MQAVNFLSRFQEPLERCERFNKFVGYTCAISALIFSIALTILISPALSAALPTFIIGKISLIFFSSNLTFLIFFVAYLILKNKTLILKKTYRNYVLKNELSNLDAMERGLFQRYDDLKKQKENLKKVELEVISETIHLERYSSKPEVFLTIAKGDKERVLAESKNTFQQAIDSKLEREIATKNVCPELALFLDSLQTEETSNLKIEILCLPHPYEPNKEKADERITIPKAFLKNFIFMSHTRDKTHSLNFRHFENATSANIKFLIFLELNKVIPPYESAPLLLDLAHKILLINAEKRLLKTIVRHFQNLKQNDSFLTLPKHLLFQVFNSDDLEIKNEQELLTYFEDLALAELQLTRETHLTSLEMQSVYSILKAGAEHSLLHTLRLDELPEGTNAYFDAHIRPLLQLSYPTTMRHYK